MGCRGTASLNKMVAVDSSVLRKSVSWGIKFFLEPMREWRTRGVLICRTPYTVQQGSPKPKAVPNHNHKHNHKHNHNPNHNHNP